MEGPRLSHRRYIERLVITLLIVGLALLLWQLRGLLILFFAAALVGVILNLLAGPFREHLRVPDALALLLSALILLALFAVAFWTFGSEVVSQASTLRTAIPAGWQGFLNWLEPYGLSQPLQEWISGVDAEAGGISSSIGGIARTVGNGIVNTVLVIVGGIYLAAQPNLYKSGVLKLVPERGRPLAEQALEDSGNALKLWLLGRLVSMTVVGLLTGFGLWLIGVPSALTLGLLAALLDFVPFLGPILAAVPGVLLAILQGPQVAAWTAGLYLLVQQIEGNFLEPLVQQYAVDLPPALLLFSLVAGGLIFGIAGVLFAAPLTVVLYVLVKRLYVREALNTPTPIPGDDETS